MEDLELSKEIIDLIERKGYRKYPDLKEPQTLEEVLIHLCKWVPTHNRTDRNEEIKLIVRIHMLMLYKLDLVK